MDLERKKEHNRLTTVTCTASGIVHGLVVNVWHKCCFRLRPYVKCMKVKVEHRGHDSSKSFLFVSNNRLVQAPKIEILEQIQLQVYLYTVDVCHKQV